jgi:LPXTG-motif cell wall-anchored protein
MKGINKRAMLSACMAAVLLASTGFGPAAEAAEASKTNAQDQAIVTTAEEGNEGESTSANENTNESEAGEAAANNAAANGTAATNNDGANNESATNEAQTENESNETTNDAAQNNTANEIAEAEAEASQSNENETTENTSNEPIAYTLSEAQSLTNMPGDIRPFVANSVSDFIVGGYYNEATDGSKENPFIILQHSTLTLSCNHYPDADDHFLGVEEKLKTYWVNSGGTDYNPISFRGTEDRKGFRIALYGSLPTGDEPIALELCGKTYYFKVVASSKRQLTAPTTITNPCRNETIWQGTALGKVDFIFNLENVDFYTYEYNTGFEGTSSVLSNPVSKGSESEPSYTAWDYYGNDTSSSHAQRIYFFFKPIDDYVITKFQGKICALTIDNGATKHTDLAPNLQKITDANIATENTYTSSYSSKGYKTFGSVVANQGFFGYGYFTAAGTTARFTLDMESKKPDVEATLAVESVSKTNDTATYTYGSDVVFKYTATRKDNIKEEADVAKANNLELSILAGSLEGTLNGTACKIGASTIQDKSQSGTTTHNVSRQDCLDGSITLAGDAGIDYKTKIYTDAIDTGSASKADKYTIESEVTGSYPVSASVKVVDPSDLVYNMQYVNTQGQTIDTAGLALPTEVTDPTTWDSSCQEIYSATGMNQQWQGKNVYTKRWNGEKVNLNGHKVGDVVADDNGGLWIFKGWKTDSSFDINAQTSNTITEVTFADSDINVYGTWVYDDGANLNIDGQVFDGTTGYASSLIAAVGDLIQADGDATEEYYNEDGEKLDEMPTDAGTYTVKVTWQLQGGSALSLSKEFVVERQSIVEGDNTYKDIVISQPKDENGNELTSSDATTSDTAEVYYLTYNGSALTPIVDVVHTDGVQKDMTDADYTVSYENNVYPGTSTVTVLGQGNYIGQVQRTFVIQPAEVKVTTGSATKVYDGEPLTNEEVSLSTGSTWYGEEAAEGYTTLEATGTITNVGTVKNTAKAMFADGTTLRSESATDTDDVTTDANDGTTDGADGTTDAGNTAGSTADNTAGSTDGSIATQATTTARAVAANACYTMSEDDMGTLEILPQSIDPADADAGTYLGITVEAPADVTYNGSARTPKPVVKDKNGNVLTEGVDYELEYVGDTTNPGTVQVKVKGIGNYTGEVETAYTINPQAIEPTAQTYGGVTFTEPADVFYNGSEQKSKPVFYDKDGNLLVEGVDYTLEFVGDLKGPGTVKVIATGIGKYSGTLEFEYEIIAADEATAASTEDTTKKSTSTAKATKTLSQTGDNTTTAAGALGGSALIAAAALMFQRLRRKQD